MEKSTPLINSSSLQGHKSQTVQVVGKIEKSTGNACMLRTSDQGMVEVIMTDSQVIPQGNYAMIFGKVDDEGERIREYRSIDLGDKLDMNLVEQCVQLQPHFPELFVGS
ncbi:replication factor A protein 3 [Meira miltonrushii]|uniref:Replication factor A protein 3 n=1 Tax=Meira miltonrushii TaxID=1280837 RepID=A0A316VF38_9BASI|nr:replication factor A protein 3 [Meira miltonrushii]PWN36150.1 replication factor A protein 3 [Meira miltonrushii]